MASYKKQQTLESFSLLIEGFFHFEYRGTAGFQKLSGVY